MELKEVLEKVIDARRFLAVHNKKDATLRKWSKEDLISFMKTTDKHLGKFQREIEEDKFNKEVLKK